MFDTFVNNWDELLKSMSIFQLS